jgi:hypothetical protein
MLRRETNGKRADAPVDEAVNHGVCRNLNIKGI